MKWGPMTPTDGSELFADVRRHLANWQDEIDSVALYGALADLEDDPRLVDVYRRLAAAEDRHAGLWEESCGPRARACPSAGRAGAPVC
jgi:hypothetical protein